MAKSREERKARKDANRQSRVGTPEESGPTTTPEPDLKAIAKRALETQLEFQKALDEGNLTGGPDEKAMIRPTEAKGTVQHRGMSGGWGYRSYPDGSIEIIEAPPGFEKHLEPPLSWLGPNDQMGHKANRKAAFNAVTKEIGGKAPEPSGGTAGTGDKAASEDPVGKIIQEVTPPESTFGVGEYSDPGPAPEATAGSDPARLGESPSDGSALDREVERGDRGLVAPQSIPEEMDIKALTDATKLADTKQMSEDAVKRVVAQKQERLGESTAYEDPARHDGNLFTGRDITKDATLVGEKLGQTAGQTVDLGEQTISAARNALYQEYARKKAQAEAMAGMASDVVSGATEGFGKGYGE